MERCDHPGWTSTQTQTLVLWFWFPRHSLLNQALTSKYVLESYWLPCETFIYSWMLCGIRALLQWSDYPARWKLKSGDIFLPVNLLWLLLLCHLGSIVSLSEPQIASGLHCHLVPGNPRELRRDIAFSVAIWDQPAFLRQRMHFSKTIKVPKKEKKTYSDAFYTKLTLILFKKQLIRSTNEF